MLKRAAKGKVPIPGDELPAVKARRLR